MDMYEDKTNTYYPCEGRIIEVQYEREDSLRTSQESTYSYNQREGVKKDTRESRTSLEHHL